MYDLGVTQAKHNRVLDEWPDLLAISLLMVRAHFTLLSSIEHSDDTRQTIGFGRLEVWGNLLCRSDTLGNSFCMRQGLDSYRNDMLFVRKWVHVF